MVTLPSVDAEVHRTESGYRLIVIIPYPGHVATFTFPHFLNEELLSLKWKVVDINCMRIVIPLSNNTGKDGLKPTSIQTMVQLLMAVMFGVDNLLVTVVSEESVMGSRFEFLGVSV